MRKDHSAIVYLIVRLSLVNGMSPLYAISPGTTVEYWCSHLMFVLKKMAWINNHWPSAMIALGLLLSVMWAGALIWLVLHLLQIA